MKYLALALVAFALAACSSPHCCGTGYGSGSCGGKACCGVACGAPSAK